MFQRVLSPVVGEWSSAAEVRGRDFHMTADRTPRLIPYPGARTAFRSPPQWLPSSRLYLRSSHVFHISSPRCGSSIQNVRQRGNISKAARQIPKPQLRFWHFYSMLYPSSESSQAWAAPLRLSPLQYRGSSLGLTVLITCSSPDAHPRISDIQGSPLTLRSHPGNFMPSTRWAPCYALTPTRQHTPGSLPCTAWVFRLLSGTLVCVFMTS